MTTIENTCTYQDKGTSVAAVTHLVTITHSKVLPGFACILVCAAYHSHASQVTKSDVNTPALALTDLIQTSKYNYSY